MLLTKVKIKTKAKITRLFHMACTFINIFSEESQNLTLQAPTSQNSQTHSNNSLTNCRRIVLSMFDDFVGLVLKELTLRKQHVWFEIS